MSAARKRYVVTGDMRKQSFNMKVVAQRVDLELRGPHRKRTTYEMVNDLRSIADNAMALALELDKQLGRHAE